MSSFSVGGSLNISDLMKQLQDKQAAANAANEGRYNYGIDTLNQAANNSRVNMGNAEAGLAQVGNTARQRIDLNEKQGETKAQQGLISRGLGNTTITNSTQRGYRDDAELQKQGVDEQQQNQMRQVYGQAAQNELGIGNDKAGFIERRSDVAPDAGLYSGLIQSAVAGANRGKVQAPTQYTGSDGKTYNSPGAAMGGGGASGGGGGGGSSSGSRTSTIGGGGAGGGGGDNRGSGGYFSGGGGAAAQTLGPISSAIMQQPAATNQNVNYSVNPAQGNQAGTQMDPNWDRTPGAMHSDYAALQHQQWLDQMGLA